MEVLGNGSTTTTSLACQLNVTPATASVHAQILRRAGLITTTRHHNAAVHALTPLDSALLLGVA